MQVNLTNLDVVVIIKALRLHLVEQLGNIPVLVDPVDTFWRNSETMPENVKGWIVPNR